MKFLYISQITGAAILCLIGTSASAHVIMPAHSQLAETKPHRLVEVGQKFKKNKVRKHRQTRRKAGPRKLKTTPRRSKVLTPPAVGIANVLRRYWARCLTFPERCKQ